MVSHLSHCIIGGKSLEFVRRCFKRQVGQFGHCFGHFLSETDVCIQTSTNGCTASSEIIQARQHSLHPLDAKLNLRCITSEFLA